MPQDPPVNKTPIALKPETFARHDSAVRYVEGLVQTRAPLASTERFPGLAPGAWGLLASGGTISAGSGLSLGSGTVTLCTQNGAALTDTGESITVYNGGHAITASYGDTVVRLAWVDGTFAVNCWGGS